MEEAFRAGVCHLPAHAGLQRRRGGGDLRLGAGPQHGSLSRPPAHLFPEQLPKQQLQPRRRPHLRHPPLPGGVPLGPLRRERQLLQHRHAQRAGPGPSRPFWELHDLQRLHLQFHEGAGGPDGLHAERRTERTPMAEQVRAGMPFAERPGEVHPRQLVPRSGPDGQVLRHLLSRQRL